MIDGMNGMDGVMIEVLKISVVCEEGEREGCEMVVVEGLTMMGLNERNGREDVMERDWRTVRELKRFGWRDVREFEPRD